MSIVITKGIITALGLEAEIIINKYALTEEKKIGALKIFTWIRKNDEWEDEKIVLLLCGEWKIQAAQAATYLCENYDCIKIINIGIVGNLNPADIAIWDVMIPNTFIQHDFYMPESIDFSKHLREPIFLEYAVGEEYNLEKFTLHLSGICATWDQFIDNEDLKTEIVETYWADIVDMEAYAILSVLRNYNILDKAVVIKSVSDGADSSAEQNSMDNLKLAMQNAVAILDFTL